MDCSVKFVPSHDTRATGPLLAMFSNGAPTPDKLQNGEKGIEFACYADPHEHRKRTLRAATETVIFEGSNVLENGEEEARDITVEHSKYVIGVFDKESNRLSLLDPGPVFEMTRRLKKPREESDAAKAFLSQPLTSSQARAQLVDVFGSKKAQTARRKKLGTKTAEESLSGVAAISATIEEQADRNIEDGDTLKTELPEENVLAPPCNRNAPTVESVYVPEEVIEREYWSLLPTTELLSAVETGSSPHGSYPGFVLRCLPSLKKMDDDEKIRTATILSYIKCLMMLVHIKSTTIPKAATAIGASPALASRLLNDFFEYYLVDGRPTRAVSKQGRDKILLRIAAMTLCVNDYTVPLGQLAKELKLSAIQLGAYYQELGCKVSAASSSEDGSNLIATLSLPLVFPTLRKPKAKRR